MQIRQSKPKSIIGRAEGNRAPDECQAGTPAGDRLEVLTTLVERYESQHEPIEPTQTGDALLYYMESRGSRNGIWSRPRSRARVAEVLTRRRPLTIDMIRKLHRGLGLRFEAPPRNFGRRVRLPVIRNKHRKTVLDRVAPGSSSSQRSSLTLIASAQTSALRVDAIDTVTLLEDVTLTPSAGHFAARPCGSRRSAAQRAGPASTLASPRRSGVSDFQRRDDPRHRSTDLPTALCSMDFSPGRISSISGTNNIDENTISTLAPVVRREALSAACTRRIRGARRRE